MIRFPLPIAEAREFALQRSLLRRTLLVLAAVIGLGAAMQAFAFSFGPSDGPGSVFNQKVFFALATKPFVWVTQLHETAKYIFFLLAAIEIAWVAGMLALEKADLQSWVAAAVRKILVLSIFFAILTHGVKWMAALIAFFTYSALVQAEGGWMSILPRILSGELNTDLFNPMGMIHRGVEVAIHILQAGLVTDPTGEVQLRRDPDVFSLRDGIAMGVLAMYIGIAGQMFIYFFEMIFVMTAGVIFLGFGGAKFTEQYVMRYIGYGFGVAVKLFVFYMILSIAMPAIDALGEEMRSGAATITVDKALVMMAAVGMLTMLLRSIPSIAASFATTPGATADSRATSGIEGAAASKAHGHVPTPQASAATSGNAAITAAGAGRSQGGMPGASPPVSPPPAANGSVSPPAALANERPYLTRNADRVTPPSGASGARANMSTSPPSSTGTTPPAARPRTVGDA